MSDGDQRDCTGPDRGNYPRISGQRINRAITRFLETLYRWIQPDVMPNGSPQLQRLHDETSRTLQRTQIAILSFSSLALLLLAAIEHDEHLLLESARARVQGVEIILGSFLSFVPFVLFVLQLYYLIYFRHLSCYHALPENERLPYAFNKRDRGLRYLNWFIILFLPLAVSILCLRYTLHLPNWMFTSRMVPLLILPPIIALVLFGGQRLSVALFGMVIVLVAAVGSMTLWPRWIAVGVQYISPYAFPGIHSLKAKDLRDRQFNFCELYFF